MLQKKSFKVLAAIPKRDGGTYWMRCGSGFDRRDHGVARHRRLPIRSRRQLRYGLGHARGHERQTVIEVAAAERLPAR